MFFALACLAERSTISSAVAVCSSPATDGSKDCNQYLLLLLKLLVKNNNSGKTKKASKPNVLMLFKMLAWVDCGSINTGGLPFLSCSAGFVVANCYGY